ncbi:MAG: hypothetical protein Q7J56_02475, partial [Deltaproteobacteria bacterium]|nr:hypothetical protein [Deltaproteobacteria bacterium]
RVRAVHFFPPTGGRHAATDCKPLPLRHHDSRLTIAFFLDLPNLTGRVFIHSSSSDFYVKQGSEFAPRISLRLISHNFQG